MFKLEAVLFYKLYLFVFIWLNSVGMALAFQVTMSPPSFGGQKVEEKSIAVKVIEGRLVGSFDIVTRKGTESISLYIDLASENKLALDEGFMKAFGLDSGRGFVTVKSPNGFTALVRSKRISALAFDPQMSRISSLFTKELSGQPVVGSLGLGALDKFHISFNVPEGKINLSAPKSPGRDRAKIAADVTVAMLPVDGGGIILPVSIPSGPEAALSLSTTQYDTLVDGDWAASAGYPAGNLPGVGLKGLRTGARLDLSQIMALRPYDLSRQDDGVKLVSGLNLFLNNIVDIDMINKIVSFTSLNTATYPQTDFAFFSAMIKGDDGPLLAYLNDYKESRLAPDAASLLLDRRLKRTASDGDILDAVRLVRDTALADNRGGVSLDLMMRLKDELPERRALITAVGRLGAAVARHDSDPETLYRLHKMIGLEELEAGNIREAWKGMLSSAFGLPRDPEVNYALGRIYEQQSRLKRAQSRYQRALELLTEASAKDEKRLKIFRQALDRVDNMLRNSQDATNG